MAVIHRLQIPSLRLKGILLVRLPCWKKKKDGAADEAQGNDKDRDAAGRKICTNHQGPH